MISLNFSGFPGAAQQSGQVQGARQTGGASQASGEGLSALFAGLLDSLSQAADRQGLEGYPAADGIEVGVGDADGGALQSLLSQLSELDTEQLTEEQQQALVQLQKQIQALQEQGEAATPEQALAKLLVTLGISPSAGAGQSSPGLETLSTRQGGAELVRLATAAFERSARGRESASDSVSRPLTPPAASGVQAQPGNRAAGNNQVLELLNTLVAQGVRGESTPARVGAQSSPSGLELRLDGIVSPGQKPLPTEWAPLKVDTGRAQWSQDLMSALGDRLSMQVNQQVREATVRLDPPDLGRIDLMVRMDGDRLSVQLNATNPAVRDMLTQHAERLRADLLEQNLQTVDVQVGTGDRRDGAPGQQPEEIIIANQPLPEEADDSAAGDRDENRWLSTSA